MHWLENKVEEIGLIFKMYPSVKRSSIFFFFLAMFLGFAYGLVLDLAVHPTMVAMQPVRAAIEHHYSILKWGGLAAFAITLMVGYFDALHSYETAKAKDYSF